MLGPSLEGVDVPETREGAVLVAIRASLARESVGNGHRVLDIRKQTVEDPELPVDGGGIQELDHQLDVVCVEEPEAAGVF